MRRQNSSQSGYALIAVLWTMALLSLIAASMIAQSRIAIQIERNEWRRLELLALAESATNLAILGLLSKGGGDVSLISGAPVRVKIGDVSVETSIQDETGKADINEVDQPMLEALLKAAGTKPDLSAEIAAAIVKWRELQSAQSGGIARPRLFRRFQSVDELLLVPGVSAEIFASLRPGLTVYSQTGSINPEVAPEYILRAFLPGETARIAAILAARKLSADVASTNVRLRSGAASMFNGRAFSIRVAAPSDGRDHVFQTVVRMTGDPQEPYWILNRIGF